MLHVAFHWDGRAHEWPTDLVLVERQVEGKKSIFVRITDKVLTVLVDDKEVSRTEFQSIELERK
jgi:hypothetical protein